MTSEHNTFLNQALSQEAAYFETFYTWILHHLPPAFFHEIDIPTLNMMTHHLMGFDVQDFFSSMTFRNQALVLSLDTPSADLAILAQFKYQTLQNYQTFLSDAPPPFPGLQTCLRITLIHFFEEEEVTNFPLPTALTATLSSLQQKYLPLTFNDLQHSCHLMGEVLIRSLSLEETLLALDVFIRAQTKDPCQLELREERKTACLHLTLAWKNVPQQDFLLQIAEVIYRHGFSLQKMVATHITPYQQTNTTVICLTLKDPQHKHKISDLLQDLVTVKYFPHQELIQKTFVPSLLMNQQLANVLKAVTDAVHQILVDVDPYLYSFSQVEEAVCRHPEVTLLLLQAFEYKFHPEKHSFLKYEETVAAATLAITHIDTGQEFNDHRRQVILKQGLNWICHLLKTNAYRHNKTALSFRLDPAYLCQTPEAHQQKFTLLPFAIFFMKGLDFTGFHIRFKDLARGGLRTVCPQQFETYLADRNTLFSECYNLALTQQKKNKDIPEGGAKGVILLAPASDLEEQIGAYQARLVKQMLSSEEISQKLEGFREQQKQERLYAAQRSYIESFMTLLNCDDHGVLRAKRIIDYYQKPEYIYLGPDENMHNLMINWISNYAKRYHYKPGICFMSSKPVVGINHKQYGVTSAGIHVYMEEMLKFIGINPSQDRFTVKMTGGPDGDVAGNQMYNLFKAYPHTASLVATLDVSGAIFDPEGVNLEEIAHLFEKERPISFYPAHLLNEGGFLLKLPSFSPNQTAQAELLKKEKGEVISTRLSSDQTHHLLRTHIHQVKADIFIPGGGRPRTLNEHNYQDFLDREGIPTSKAIIEGGNLYLSPEARVLLEQKGVFIIKDSSANKGGVICSSFEVLAGLVLSEEEFTFSKETIAQEILAVIRSRSSDEIQALLASFNTRVNPSLTHLSDQISDQINRYTDELFAYLETKSLALEDSDLWMQIFVNYCLPCLKQDNICLLKEKIPDLHKKAIIASFIAQRLIYRKGVTWSPSLLDALPLILQDKNILSH
ncbi:MAG: NAD-glutamate dehydrogenase [Candidatus Rhabdochlamydia sp.]